MQNNFSLAPQFVSVSNRGKNVILCLMVGIVVYAIGILLGLIFIAFQPLMVHSFPNDNIAGVINFVLGLQGVFGLVEALLMNLTGLLFLFWIYRAYSNLTLLQAQRQSYTPGWAVGWWFVPLANLFMPYKVVKELWEQSDPLIHEETEYWHRSNIRTLFICWWFLWLFSGLAGIAYMFYAEADTETLQVQVLTKSMMITKLFNIGAAFLCIKIISGINKRQEARSLRLNIADYQLQPAPPVFHRTTP